MSNWLQTLVARAIPFDNDTNGYESEDLQGAVEESLTTAISLPRFPTMLLMNGSMSNGDWLTYSNLTPDSSILIPIKCELREFSWANTRTSVDFDVEFYKNGRTTTKYATREIRSGTAKSGIITGLTDAFDAGDSLDLKYIDQGTNASDLTVVMFFQAVV